MCEPFTLHYVNPFIFQGNACYHMNEQTERRSRSASISVPFDLDLQCSTLVDSWPEMN